MPALIWMHASQKTPPSQGHVRLGIGGSHPTLLRYRRYGGDSSDDPLLGGSVVQYQIMPSSDTGR